MIHASFVELHLASNVLHESLLALQYTHNTLYYNKLHSHHQTLYLKSTDINRPFASSDNEHNFCKRSVWTMPGKATGPICPNDVSLIYFQTDSMVFIFPSASYSNSHTFRLRNQVVPPKGHNRDETDTIFLCILQWHDE